jgi:multidrug efflux system membrane fusion protein
VTIPSVAIQRGPDGIFTWVVAAGNIAQTRAITSGPTSGDLTIVTSGLEAGERVVVDGQYKLRQNSLVSDNAPAAPAAVAKRDRAS